jgi:site-specific recombinase XerC
MGSAWLYAVLQSVRDRAILVLLCGADLRPAESAALKLVDYDPETGRILVRSCKGGFCNGSCSRAVSTA